MENANCIEVHSLAKKFLYRDSTKRGFSYKNFFLFPERKEIMALKDISFSVRQGSRVALLGPNGAGKSTTIRILSGILHPTSGHVSVLGLEPSKRRKQLARKTASVFGQRSQLFANLPIMDSLEFFGAMYGLTRNASRDRANKLVGMLKLDDFLTQPVRKLSLGQRMRGEIAASLMHRPKIIFLDEPTLGLDALAKSALRDALLAMQKSEGLTLFISTHDAGDIEILSERILMINQGKLINDIATASFVKTILPEKFIKVFLKHQFNAVLNLPPGALILEKTELTVRFVLDTSLTTTKTMLDYIFDKLPVQDLELHDAALELAIKRTYENNATDRRHHKNSMAKHNAGQN